MPNFKSAYRFENSNLVSVNMGKSTVTLDKPIYLGQAILDISKKLMYDFHYNYIKARYGDCARLLFTDTDSLCYVIITNDFYEDIREDVPTMFDTSDYPEDHPAGLVRTNKKVIGMTKDECKAKQMTEFVGLRPKAYAGKKPVVENNITFENYKECLFGGKTLHAKFNTLRSRKHNVTTECITKVALTPKDDKRYIIPNDPEHKPLALGH